MLGQKEKNVDAASKGKSTICSQDVRLFRISNVVTNGIKSKQTDLFAILVDVGDTACPEDFSPTFQYNWQFMLEFWQDGIRKCPYAHVVEQCFDRRECLEVGKFESASSTSMLLGISRVILLEKSL